MLLNAVEAREKSRKGISKETESQLFQVEKNINDSIQKGETSCLCYKHLNKQVIDRLNDLGYRISDYSSQKDDSIYKIIW